MNKISAVIITYNEEKNIARCIDSVRAVADEIVVADSFSTDRTKEICLSKGVRFMEHVFEGYIEQKNFALAQASHDHVLSLDADEYLSGELLQSILKVKETWPFDAYRMNRLSSYGGKWIRRGNWYPDRKVRLWNRKQGVWGGEKLHEKVILNSGVRVKQLQGNLLHRAYKDSHETLSKVQRYSYIFSQEMTGHRKVSTALIVLKGFFAFFKSYIIKRGIFDGFEGLMVAFAVCNHTVYKYAKLYELNHKRMLGKRIIISRTDSIGDVVLALPLAGFLKSELPDVKVYFLGRPYTRGVIECCEHVEEYIDREEVLKNPEVLQKINADSILFVYPDVEMAKLAESIGIRNRVATAHRWYNWLYCNYLIDFSRVRSQQHECLLNFNLLHPFKLCYDLSLAELPQYYGMRVASRDWSHLLDKNKINIVIHPKGVSAKVWPLESYQKLIEELQNRNVNIFITGVATERERIEIEDPRFLHQEGVTDLTGKLSLKELITFLAQADALVAGNTGVLHLGAALGIPSVGLYSPRRPIHPGRWMPLGKNASHLVMEKECNNCKKEDPCACLAEISVKQVLSQVIKMLPSEKHVVARK